jgi:hypothetical protein
LTRCLLFCTQSEISFLIFSSSIVTPALSNLLFTYVRTASLSSLPPFPCIRKKNL